MSLPLSVRSLFFYLFLSFCLFPFLYSVFVFVLVLFQQQTKPIQFIPNRNGKREKYLSSHILITKAECSVFNARSCRMIWRTSYALFVRFKNQWAIRRTKNPYKKKLIYKSIHFCTHVHVVVVVFVKIGTSTLKPLLKIIILITKEKRDNFRKNLVTHWCRI